MTKKIKITDFTPSVGGASLVCDLVLEQGVVKGAVSVAYPIARAQEQILEEIKQHIQQSVDCQAVDISLVQQIAVHQTQANVPPIANIKNIIAVASGKGGVGKSTTATNLAVALKMHGAKVGLLDADIHGPNQPLMLGYPGGKPDVADKKFQPLMLHGLATMSIGYLIDAAQPTIWRGPMVSGAITQMLNDTAWPELDYLIIDMPPGTGDAQLTLAQKIPVSAAVIVTTPQEVAVADARKGLAMFKKVNIPVLGIVENMSYYLCCHCGEKDYLFGEGGGKRMAEQFNTSLLGEIPLNSDIRKHGDSGQPYVLNDGNIISQAYLDMALLVATKLSLQSVAYTDKFLKVRTNRK